MTDQSTGVRVDDLDACLLARAQRGDKGAFEELYLKHRDHMYTLCLNLCGNPEQAQDLLQDTFVRAYRGLRGFRSKARFSTWLHRIAINLHRDALRHQRRSPSPGQIVTSIPRHSDDNVHQVRAALRRLKSPHRIVLVLRYMQTLSYHEIADLLHWSLPRVKVTLHRAKRAFKDAYLEMDETQP